MKFSAAPKRPRRENNMFDSYDLSHARKWAIEHRTHDPETADLFVEHLKSLCLKTNTGYALIDADTLDRIQRAKENGWESEWRVFSGKVDYSEYKGEFYV